MPLPGGSEAHSNKLNQVSGDWNRQPDTLVALESDPDKQETKLTWAKVRWERQRPEGWRSKNLLRWLVEHKGYELVDIDLHGASDTELEARIDAYLAEHPLASKTTIMEAVGGNAKRVRGLLDAGVQARKYDVVGVPRGAKLHLLTHDPVRPVDGVADGVAGNPDD